MSKVQIEVNIKEKNQEIQKETYESRVGMDKEIQKSSDERIRLEQNFKDYTDFTDFMKKEKEIEKEEE